ncbi:MAG TPA: GatB/YqeY domain-containing protein [Thermoanaerobaculia bacterium]|nr:GatB/YqeY domain-containing protein [Thermoanaerobaculia bacterium]
MSESPQARLEADLKEAMKARDKDRTATLRMLLAMVKNRRIELGADIGEAELVALARKSIKQREDSATQYRQGNRPELAQKEEAEISILEAYLPPPVDETAVREEVRAYLRAAGLSGPKAMGAVMKEMSARYAGKVDGKTLSGIVREELAG